jgi:hypothetical protein
MDSISMTTRIAIVYHSGRGHTRRQAETVTAGVHEVEGRRGPSAFRRGIPGTVGRPGFG